ncbi:MAG: polysaccharide ABC transporter ATP-binding protein [Chthoniobacterales bacterium]
METDEGDDVLDDEDDDDDELESGERKLPEGPPCIEVVGVSKRFCRDLKRSLLYGVQDIGREFVGMPARVGELKKNEFWAVQDVSFELPRGSAMGLVGTNGSGKTTLMRIMSGIIKPTIGHVTVRGRLAPLLALGAGFNSILTGRENIYTNMSILGLTREEIDAKFDEVVEYSEIEYALDAPVQTYSSGMTARLGFACAIHTQPDILLMDEVLAVGDMQFREKCIKTLQELRDGGTSFIIVHHFPDILLAVCDLAMYVSGGKRVQFGKAAEVLEHYEEDLHAKRKGKSQSGGGGGGGGGSTADGSEVLMDPVIENERAKVTAVEVYNEDDRAGGDAREPVIQNESPSVLLSTLQIDGKVDLMNIVVQVMRLPTMDTMAESMMEQQVLKISTKRDCDRIIEVRPGEYEVRLKFPWLGLLPGMYQARVSLYSRKTLLARRRSKRFRVGAKRKGGFDGKYFQPREWDFDIETGKRERGAAKRRKAVLGEVEAVNDE